MLNLLKIIKTLKKLTLTLYIVCLGNYQSEFNLIMGIYRNSPIPEEVARFLWTKVVKECGGRK